MKLKRIREQNRCRTLNEVLVEFLIFLASSLCYSAVILVAFIVNRSKTKLPEFQVTPPSTKEEDQSELYARCVSLFLNQTFTVKTLANY